MWQIEDHTADVRLAVEAAGWPELLAEAARALGGWLCAGVAADGGGRGLVERPLECRGDDAAETWVRWWRALLRLWTVEGLLPVDARIEAAEPGLVRGRVRCLPAAELDLERCADPKAVTWHGAEAGPRGERWFGRIVLDV
jgi:SHS2 domain-containing protein